MRRAALLLAGVLLCSIPSPALAQDATCQPEAAWGPARQEFAKRVVELVNAHRGSIGRGPLAISRSLSRAALWKSRHMFHFRYFTHDDPAPPVARPPHERMVACGFQNGEMGENIARNPTSPEEVFQGWLASPGHRTNIERDSYTQIGVGVAGTDYGLHWTQNFGGGPVNDPNSPPTAFADTLVMREDSPAVRVDVLANDTDDDKPWLYVGSAKGATVVENGLALTYAPPKDFNGRVPVGYTLVDLAGETSQAVLTVTVTRVNDPPVAAADRTVMRRRARRTVVRVTANDSDVDGDRLRVSIVRRPKHGRARALSGGRVEYRPRRRPRRDSFVYRVRDAAGATAQATVTVGVRR